MQSGQGLTTGSVLCLLRLFAEQSIHRRARNSGKLPAAEALTSDSVEGCRQFATILRSQLRSGSHHSQ